MSGSAMINHDPVMPAEVRGRLADNWRSQIAVADACSPAWGALTREAAVAFSKSCHDEDILVVLLQHILEVFDACGVDRLASKTLVDALVDMDDAGWSEWRGLRDDQQPRQLSQGELARLLAPFCIRPRSIWPRLRRQDNGKSSKGYFRWQFEAAWRAYCGGNHGISVQVSDIARLCQHARAPAGPRGQ